MENVAGILHDHADRGRPIDEVCRLFRENGYEVNYRLFDSLFHGLPQVPFSTFSIPARVSVLMLSSFVFHIFFFLQSRPRVYLVAFLQGHGCAKRAIDAASAMQAAKFRSHVFVHSEVHHHRRT